jgi:hypothetical protein
MNTKIFLSIAIILLCVSCKSKTNQEVSNNSEQKTDMPVGFSVLRIPEDETPQEEVTSQENETHQEKTPQEEVASQENEILREKWSHLKINSYFKNAINKYRDQIDDIYEHLTDWDYNHDRSRTFYEHRHMSDSDRIKDLYDELLTLTWHSPRDLIFNFEKRTVRGVNSIDIDEVYYATRLYIDYISYIRGFPTDKTISGDFNGDGKIDSLMIGYPYEKLYKDFRLLSSKDVTKEDRRYEELGKKLDEAENTSKCHIEFVFSDKTIPKLRIFSNFYYTIKNEGDLDGDGGDEIGFIPGGDNMGFIRGYSIFTLKNNEWYELSMPSTFDIRVAGLASIEKDPEQKGVFLLRKSAATCMAGGNFIIERSIKTKDLWFEKVK